MLSQNYQQHVSHLLHTPRPREIQSHPTRRSDESRRNRQNSDNVFCFSSPEAKRQKRREYRERKSGGPKRWETEEAKTTRRYISQYINQYNQSNTYINIWLYYLYFIYYIYYCIYNIISMYNIYIYYMCIHNIIWMRRG